jgi:hypothetical protein
MSTRLIGMAENYRRRAEAAEMYPEQQDGIPPPHVVNSESSGEHGLEGRLDC